MNWTEHPQANIFEALLPESAPDLRFACGGLSGKGEALRQAAREIGWEMALGPMLFPSDYLDRKRFGNGKAWRNVLIKLADAADAIDEAFGIKGIECPECKMLNTPEDNGRCPACDAEMGGGG